MNETQRAKIQRFLDDKIMSEAVKSVILGAFLKPSKKNDVQTLAAERIAIDLLEEGFKELNKYALEEKKEKAALSQVGL